MGYRCGRYQKRLRDGHSGGYSFLFRLDLVSLQLALHEATPKQMPSGLLIHMSDDTH